MNLFRSFQSLEKDLTIKKKIEGVGDAKTFINRSKFFFAFFHTEN